MLYHYTFRTYKSKPVLRDSEMRNSLLGDFFRISTEKGFEIIACEMLSDHVHILIEQDYSLSSSIVMKLLKAISARNFFKMYDTNRFEMRKLWGRSFDARKITANEKQRVIEYIRKQRTNEGIDKRFL